MNRSDALRLLRDRRSSSAGTVELPDPVEPNLEEDVDGELLAENPRERRLRATNDVRWSVEASLDL